jgi:hypothetical protein
MKRLLALVIFLPMLILPCSAGTDPSHTYSFPGMGMVVAPDCPIAVSHNDLTFDLSGADGFPLAQVEAAYTLTNPTNQTQVVQVTLPYVTCFGRFPNSTARVYENGSAVDCDTFYGGSIKNNRDYIYDVYFEDILSNVVFPQPPELEDGILYNLHVDISSVPEETVAFYVLINFKLDGDLCLTSHDSTSALNDDGQATLKIYYSLQYKQGPIRVFVPGGSISDFSAMAYKKSNLEEQFEYVSFDLEVDTTSMWDFTLTVDKDYGYYGSMDFSEYSYRALLADLYSELESREETDQYNGFVSLRKLLYDSLFRYRLAVAVFDLEFAAGEDKDIMVMYTIDPTYDKPHKDDRDLRYTYNYISSPAPHWSDFGTMSIKVIPPDDNELYLKSSRPKLKLDTDGTYYAELGKLRKKIDFTFATPENGYARVFGLKPHVFLILLAITVSLVIAIVKFLQKPDKRWRRE